MRTSSSLAINLLPALLCFAPSSYASGSYDCTNAYADSTHWNLGALKGEKSVSWAHPRDPKIWNTTFTFKLCAVGDIIKPDGTIEDETAEKVAVAGSDFLSSGHTLDPQWTRLKSSDSNSDVGKLGVRLEMQGKKYEGVKQKAIIEFLCIDKEKTSNEEEFESDKREMRRDAGDNEDQDEDEDEGDGDDDDDDEDDDDDDDEGSDKDDQDAFDKEHKDWVKLRTTGDGEGGTITFLRYQIEEHKGENSKVLRLEWKTPHACEGASSDLDLHPAGGGWGFFRWLFFLVFVGFMGYFIFFAWINYSKNGARGWDVLPHADTMRDMPYILGDFGRKVMGSIQGGGRGGYAAV